MTPEGLPSRLPPLAPVQLDRPQEELYAAITGGPRAADRGRSPITDAEGHLLGPFNAMLYNPALGDPMQGLGAAIRYRTSLEAAPREVAILTVAATLDSEFEWFAHERLARGAGVSEETITRIADGREPDGDDALIYRAAHELILDSDLSDERFAEVQERFGVTGCVELVVLIGYYRMLALVLRTFRVSAPSGD
ncbi:MAG TPA: carboxymuconolactone decarboxylase family protein [Solirubrobacteraceae bacterium]|nr:carboxymuconolactone decarboxylase family protein [Solirubrobacteraceae bacterium]